MVVVVDGVRTVGAVIVFVRIPHSTQLVLARRSRSSAFIDRSIITTFNFVFVIERNVIVSTTIMIVVVVVVVDVAVGGGDSITTHEAVRVGLDFREPVAAHAAFIRPCLTGSGHVIVGTIVIPIMIAVSL